MMRSDAAGPCKEHEHGMCAHAGRCDAGGATYGYECPRIYMPQGAQRMSPTTTPCNVYCVGVWCVQGGGKACTLIRLLTHACGGGRAKNSTVFPTVTHLASRCTRWYRAQAHRKHPRQHSPIISSNSFATPTMASDSEDHSDLSSNYSGSDYSSDEGEQTLEQPVSDSATPSQPATSNRTPASAPIVPRLGVSSLVLGSRSAGGSSAPHMMTARPGVATPPPTEQQQPSAVHLVSFAFTLDTTPSTDADLHAVRTRCVDAFGVAPEELTLFDLRTRGGNGAPAIGVAINNSSTLCCCCQLFPALHNPLVPSSGFSLEAMEQLLANNQQLSSAAERSACNG